jgi:signal transduction histidine kinase
MHGHLTYRTRTYIRQTEAFSNTVHVHSRLLHAHTIHPKTVSHELRTPLNGIIGLSESLLDDDECTPSVAKTLEIILSSGHRLNSLVNDILDAASLKHGVLQVKHSSVNLAEVSEQVLGSLV